MQILLDMHSRIPIYEQIENEIALQVQRGILKPNEQLPSLRQLSAQLSLNINTVKRALGELEAKGITYSVAGKGIFISPTAKAQNVYVQESMDAAEKAIRSAKNLGVSYEELFKTLKSIYEEENT